MGNTLSISNWDKWQTYRKDRGTPPWIKIHRNLMTNQEWSSLSDAEKGQLVSIWIIAADKKGIIPSDPKILRKFCQLDSAPNVKKFIELGFVTTTCQPSDDQVTTTCQPSDAPETETETETETDICPKEIALFDDFYKNYPKKKGKQAAIKAWNKLSPSPELLKTILTSLKSQCNTKDWTKENGQYIPLPATWLNGKRWEDEFEVEYDEWGP